MFEVCYGVGVRWEGRSKEMSHRRKMFNALKKCKLFYKNQSEVFIYLFLFFCE